MYCLFCDVSRIVCVYTSVEHLPPGGYPIGVKYIYICISYIYIYIYIYIVYYIMCKAQGITMNFESASVKKFIREISLSCMLSITY
jgi:hypothetical protein